MPRLARRASIILALAGLLAGCQQPDGGGTVRPAPRSGEVEQLRYFEPEFNVLLDELVGNLERACASSAVDDRRLNACLRDSFVAAFDDSRQGRRNCDFHTEIVKFIGCIAIGNTLLDVRHRLSDDSPVPAAFWRDEEAMVKAFTETIVKRGIDACGVSGDQRRLKECVISSFERQVALPASVGARCQPLDDNERYTCLIEGVMLRYLQEHVPRLGSVNT